MYQESVMSVTYSFLIHSYAVIIGFCLESYVRYWAIRARWTYLKAAEWKEGKAWSIKLDSDNKFSFKWFFLCLQKHLSFVHLSQHGPEVLCALGEWRTCSFHFFKQLYIYWVSQGGCHGSKWYSFLLVVTVFFFSVL